MKKLILTMLLTLIFCGLYSTSAYASTYESKYWIIDKEAGSGSYYARYGHIKITGDVSVVMCLFDNGKHVTYKPIIYSNTYNGNVSVWCGGNHADGNSNDLEVAKNLSDYYSNNGTISDYKTLVDLSNEPTYCIYNTWSYSFTEYGNYGRNNLNFETSDVPKFYYYEEGATLNSQDMFVNAFNSYINGNTTDFTIENGSITSVADYSLEPPLNVKVNNYNPKKVILQWEQSENKNIDGWETEVYIKQKGTYKKTIFSTKKNYDTGWQIQPFTSTYKKKYIFNSLALKSSDDFLIDLIDNNGHNPQVSTVEKTDIMLRNKFIDNNGNAHYSNYVYLYQDSDYKYIANEVDGSKLDENEMTTDNIDSNVVTDSEIYNNSDTSSYLDNVDVTSSSGVGMLRSLLNDIKDFPRFFYEFFCFIPEQVYLAISALIVCLVPIALIKLVL